MVKLFNVTNLFSQLTLMYNKEKDKKRMIENVAFNKSMSMIYIFLLELLWNK